MDGWAVVGGRLMSGVTDVTSDPAALDSTGTWLVVQTFEESLTCLRVDRVVPADAFLESAPSFDMPSRDRWTTSIERSSYVEKVERVRQHIADGDVYQVNLCRVLSVETAAPDLQRLGGALARGNPAPYAATLCFPDADVMVASASPELFLSRDGDVVSSRPIKGTARKADGLADKDVAENVMIVDLVRNDLSRVAEPGTVDVPSLLSIESHPGLVHLVSTVTARLRAGCGWVEMLAAAAPAGSVSGAPKSSALRIIGELEPVPRGVYCGAVGWVDADAQQGALAVGIRTYAWSAGRLQLGTGAGITWGSDPAKEWDETELKVSRLLQV
ncbi:MAG: chorismate-binding protein [Frankiales bacterium]|nr:chorismate-binding protein [Frankiales bacterium]